MTKLPLASILILTVALAHGDAASLARQRERDKFLLKPKPFNRADFAPRANRPTAPSYELLHEVSFRGTIVGVQSVPTAGGDSRVDLLIRLSNGGTSLVEIAPQKYLDQQRVEFHAGNQITINGMKAKDATGSVVLPTNLNYRGDHLALRRANGETYWH